MATGGASSVDKITEDLQRKLTVQDTAGGIISVACWNIMGEACADHRQKVVYNNFKNHHLDLQADIICLQEVPVRCLGKTFTKYVPVSSSDYRCEECKEPGSNKYNAVLYKKENFDILDAKMVLKIAFLLMEVKRKTYESDQSWWA